LVFVLFFGFLPFVQYLSVDDDDDVIVVWLFGCALSVPTHFTHFSKNV